MISYKDRTYCVAKCARSACSAKLTAEIKEAAKRVSLPISAADFSKSCVDYEKVSG